MIDPAMARNYLSALSGAAGGQAGGIQGLLANLRGQLYGPQAATAAGYPDFSAAGGQDSGLQPQPYPGEGSQQATSAQKPAWQQLREAGIQGQGSAAANRALVGNPQEMAVQRFAAQNPGLTPDLIRGAASQPQSMSGGGLQAGGGGLRPMGQPQVMDGLPPSAGQQLAKPGGGGSDGISPQIQDVLRQGAASARTNPGASIDPGFSGGAARNAMALLTGGLDPSMFSTPPPPPPGGGPFVGMPQGGSDPAARGFQAGTLPLPSAAGQPMPLKPGGVPAMSAPMVPEAAPRGGLRAPLPAPRAASAAGVAGPQAAGKPSPAGAQSRTGTVGAAAQAPKPSPAALGTDGFKGPNARRLQDARAGIYENVRTALARPRPGGGAGGRR